MNVDTSVQSRKEIKEKSTELDALGKITVQHLNDLVEQLKNEISDHDGTKKLVTRPRSTNPMLDSTIRKNPRPSESNAIPSPGFQQIRRIPVGSVKILYWIRKKLDEQSTTIENQKQMFCNQQHELGCQKDINRDQQKKIDDLENKIAYLGNSYQNYWKFTAVCMLFSMATIIYMKM
ncbi:unnamed protein product [Adineta ricciae]|uniref:Uncharacterized protein n=1 Tax=Adineta ricciae TaxID=249248 RepID=A0A813WW36_ADIRI|nr:unnamed protein product [Adineta ricciae]